MKMFFRNCLEFLCRHGIVEPMFDKKYPHLPKTWVEAVTELADKRINRRFLVGAGVSHFSRYKIHPLRAGAVFLRWLLGFPARNA